MSLRLLYFLAVASLSASQDFLPKLSPALNGRTNPRVGRARLFPEDPPANEGGAGKDLPQLNYRYACFAVRHPEAASAFFEKYTGAVHLDASEHQLVARANAEVCGSRLWYRDDNGDSAFSDVYWIYEPRLSLNLPEGVKDPVVYGKEVSDVHSWAQEDWDWFQDWHLAFSFHDLDAAAARLLRDGVPFVNRIAMYFAIPDTGITIQFLGAGTIYWTEPFLFCRRTTDKLQGRQKPQVTNITTIEDALSRPLPGMAPNHQAMASANAHDCAEWIYRLLPVFHKDEQLTPEENHAYADGTCADIRWVKIANSGGWEMHWVEQHVKRTGGIDIAAQEQSVKDLRGDFTQWDAYMHFRVGLKVDNLTAYKEHFKAQNEPFFIEEATDQTSERMFVAMPNSYVAELFEEQVSVIDDAVANRAIAAALHEAEEGYSPERVAAMRAEEGTAPRRAEEGAAAMRAASRLIEV